MNRRRARLLRPDRHDGRVVRRSTLIQRSVVPGGYLTWLSMLYLRKKSA